MDEKRLQLVPLAAMAGLLRLSPADLRKDVEDGLLPAVRIGKRGLLFHVATIEGLLRQRAEQASARALSDDHEAEQGGKVFP